MCLGESPHWLTHCRERINPIWHVGILFGASHDGVRLKGPNGGGGGGGGGCMERTTESVVCEFTVDVVVHMHWEVMGRIMIEQDGAGHKSSFMIQGKSEF